MGWLQFRVLFTIVFMVAATDKCMGQTSKPFLDHAQTPKQCLMLFYRASMQGSDSVGPNLITNFSDHRDDSMLLFDTLKKLHAFQIALIKKFGDDALEKFEAENVSPSVSIKTWPIDRNWYENVEINEEDGVVVVDNPGGGPNLRLVKMADSTWKLDWASMMPSTQDTRGRGQFHLSCRKLGKVADLGTGLISNDASISIGSLKLSMGKAFMETSRMPQK